MGWSSHWTRPWKQKWCQSAETDQKAHLSLTIMHVQTSLHACAGIVAWFFTNLAKIHRWWFTSRSNTLQLSKKIDANVPTRTPQNILILMRSMHSLGLVSDFISIISIAVLTQSAAAATAVQHPHSEQGIATYLKVYLMRLYAGFRQQLHIVLWKLGRFLCSGIGKALVTCGYWLTTLVVAVYVVQ